MESLLGHTSALVVRKVDAAGAWLASGASDTRESLIPLPANDTASPLEVGASVNVFVYKDSNGDFIATTRAPSIQLGEVDVLMVTDLAPFGAFVSWGLKKDLLVPLREQTRPLRVGERCAVGLYVDDTSRLAGTMRVAELLRSGGDYALDAWVPGVVWRDEPGLGTFVILEKRSLALLPKTEPHALRAGDAARFRVAHVHADGKLEVSLRGLKHEELEGDAQRILDLLLAPHPPKLGDASSPERIRGLLGISKKAFKRAAGRLLKMGNVAIDDEGFLRVLRAPGESP